MRRTLPAPPGGFPPGAFIPGIGGGGGGPPAPRPMGGMGGGGGGGGGMMSCVSRFDSIRGADSFFAVVMAVYARACCLIVCVGVQGVSCSGVRWTHSVTVVRLGMLSQPRTLRLPALHRNHQRRLRNEAR
jgi:hypothetical protein